MAGPIQCVGCGVPFDVADDDPLWSRTTELVDGVEHVTGRHIEPPCPACGTTATHAAGVTEQGGVAVRSGPELVNRIDVTVDPPVRLEDDA